MPEHPFDTVLIEEIFVAEDRQRQDMGDLNELVESFRSSAGQINPLSVTWYPGGDGFRYSLIAGERRLQALKLAGYTTALVRVYDSLEPWELEMIELTENVIRKDLTWQERARAVKRVHELKCQEHGVSPDPVPHKDQAWSFSHTGRFMGVDPKTVSNDIRLAKALEVSPDIAKAKNASEAQKILLRVAENQLRAELAKRAKAKIAEGKENPLLNAYILGDSLTKLRKLGPAESFDFIDLDPPYGIDFGGTSGAGALHSGQSKAYTEFLNKDFTDVPKEEFEGFLKNILGECFRLLKPTGWMSLWFSTDPWWDTVYNAVISSGFMCSKHPAVWYKTLGFNLSQGSNSSPFTQLTPMYEPFFYARKSAKAVIQRPGRYNVFSYERFADSERFHPTEKPINLMQDILLTFALPGSRVLVPFAGSGNTLIAAYREHMTAIGFDLSETYQNAFLARAGKEKFK